MDNYDILKLNVQNLTYDDVINEISTSNSQVVISSVNPEIVLQCEQDSNLARIINNSTLRIADGTGIVWAVEKIYKAKIERITGIDTMEYILKSELNNKRVFLYGSKPGVAKDAMKLLNEKYQCNIVGYMDGYVSSEEAVITEINNLQAEIVFVGTGCPSQELWIEANKDKLSKVKLLMGVGGSFDVLSGNVKRAPNFIQKARLEWLYRLVLQPKRIFRQMKLVSFVIKILRVRN